MAGTGHTVYPEGVAERAQVPDARDDGGVAVAARGHRGLVPEGARRCPRPPASRQLGAARAVPVPPRGGGERAAGDQVSARDTRPTGSCRAVGFAGCTVRAGGCAWTACRGRTRSDRGHTVHEAPRARRSTLTLLRPPGAFLGRCRSGSVRIIVTEWRRDGEQAVMRQGL